MSPRSPRGIWHLYFFALNICLLPPALRGADLIAARRAEQKTRASVDRQGIFSSFDKWA